MAQETRKRRFAAVRVDAKAYSPVAFDLPREPAERARQRILARACRFVAAGHHALGLERKHFERVPAFALELGLVLERAHESFFIETLFACHVWHQEHQVVCAFQGEPVHASRKLSYCRARVEPPHAHRISHLRHEARALGLVNRRKARIRERCEESSC